jgi:hypothetical protein
MSRFILIIVLGGYITYSITSMTQNKSVTQATENSVNNYSQTKARNIANSTIQMLMSKVADNKSWRQTTLVTMKVFDGSAEYTVTDANFNGEKLIKYSVTANVYSTTKQVTAYSDELSLLPGGIRGAITANNPVDTKGNLTVDGRNHTKDGTLVNGSGSYSIWGSSTISQNGNSKYGGTYSGIDYAPSKPGDPNIISENQIWPGGFPDSPDKVMGGEDKGFSEGTLLDIANSGVNGSQYATDPDDLSGPFSGVTYLEMSGSKENDRTWQSMEITGSGILIIHNSSTNSIMKNLNSGTFKGLIIVDDMVHIHADIIGAVVILTSTPSSGNCVGNGNGNVLYSTEAVQDAMTQVGLQTSTLNFGFGKNRLNVKYWLE